MQNVVFVSRDPAEVHPESVVRSAQMVSFAVTDSFTVEFWVFLESFSTSSSDEQLLLLFGTQEGSLSITLSNSITISRCENHLRIPHGIPLHKWTHVAIVFGPDDDITLLLNGDPVADGILSKVNCNVPTFAYLQVGRGTWTINTYTNAVISNAFVFAWTDTMGILPDTSVLLGAMDEVPFVHALFCIHPFAKG